MKPNSSVHVFKNDNKSNNHRNKTMEVIPTRSLVYLGIAVNERMTLLYNHRSSDMNAMKIQARNTTMGSWQERWDNEDVTGQWTRRLIDVRAWINCKHRRDIT